MIFELLTEGRENARTARDLAKLTGLDRRAVSLLVERERRAGKPICATCDGTAPGYYVAADRDEMQRYCDNLRHREQEIAKTREACEGTIDSLPAGMGGILTDGKQSEHHRARLGMQDLPRPEGLPRMWL